MVVTEIKQLWLGYWPLLGVKERKKDSIFGSSVLIKRLELPF